MRYVSQIFAWLLPGYSSLIQAVEDFWRIRLQRRSRGRYLSQSVVRPFNDSGRHVNGPVHRWSKSVSGGVMTQKKNTISQTWLNRRGLRKNLAARAGRNAITVRHKDIYAVNRPAHLPSPAKKSERKSRAPEACSERNASIRTGGKRHRRLSGPASPGSGNRAGKQRPAGGAAVEAPALRLRLSRP